MSEIHSDILILNELFADNAKLSLVGQSNRRNVKLTEPQAPDSSFEIRGLPVESVVIKADVFCGQQGFFAGTKGECKNADYIIFSNTGHRKVIVFVEMKRTKGSKTEIEKKFEAARCLVFYCQKLGACFWGERGFLSGFEQRFISVGHTSIAKRPTRILRNTGGHNDPSKMMKIDWPSSLEFKKIVGS